MNITSNNSRRKILLITTNLKIEEMQTTTDKLNDLKIDK